MSKSYALFVGADAVGFLNNGTFFPDYSAYLVGPTGAVGQLTDVVTLGVSNPTFNFNVIADRPRNLVLFSQSDATNKNQLWVYNGNTGQTTELLNVTNANSTFGLEPNSYLELNGQVLFSGADASGRLGLWTTDGTAQHTFELLP